MLLWLLTLNVLISTGILEILETGFLWKRNKI